MAFIIKHLSNDIFPLLQGHSTKEGNYRGDTFNNFLWDCKCHPELSLQES